MKKTICIILSAILISVFFVIGVLAVTPASIAFYTGTISSLNNESLSSITVNSASLPLSETTDTFLYAVITQPNYEELNDLIINFNYVPQGNRTYIGTFYYVSEGVLHQSNISPTAEGKTRNYDISSLTENNVEAYVISFNISNNFVYNVMTATLDYSVPSVWDGIGDYITGMFGGIASLITGIKGSGNNIVLLFVIVIPLAAICIAYLFKFLGKRRRYRVRRKK